MRELTVELDAHFNGLTAAEDERLALLAEECAEVIQIVAKIQRHGYESTNPTTPSQTITLTNRYMLEKEIGDVLAVMDLLCAGGADLDTGRIEQARQLKHAKLPRWTHHQEGPR